MYYLYVLKQLNPKLVKLETSRTVIPLPTSPNGDCSVH